MGLRYQYTYDAIDSTVVATKLLDMAVNMGHKQAVKLLQSACLHFIKNNLAIDGILGTVTLNIVNSLSENTLLTALRNEQVIFYEALIINKPALAVFRNGWMKRALA